MGNLASTEQFVNLQLLLIIVPHTVQQKTRAFNVNLDSCPIKQIIVAFPAILEHTAMTVYHAKTADFPRVAMNASPQQGHAHRAYLDMNTFKIIIHARHVQQTHSVPMEIRARQAQIIA